MQHADATRIGLQVENICQEHPTFVSLMWGVVQGGVARNQANGDHCSLLAAICVKREVPLKQNQAVVKAAIEKDCTTILHEYLLKPELRRTDSGPFLPGGGAPAEPAFPNCSVLSHPDRICRLKAEHARASGTDRPDLFHRLSDLTAHQDELGQRKEQRSLLYRARHGQ